MKYPYTITIGETGNNIGHPQTSMHATDEAAIRKARRLCRETYGDDGWWLVRCLGFECRGGRA